MRNSPMRCLLPLLLAGLLASAALPAFAVDTEPAAGAPDLAAIRARIDAQDYKGAIADLTILADSGTRDPDVYNLLGYSIRQSGDLAMALTYYQKALDFDPDHKGALEYSGELYVKIGDLAKARANETRLRKLCPQGCEELAELSAAIAQAAKTN